MFHVLGFWLVLVLMLVVSRKGKLSRSCPASVSSYGAYSSQVLCLQLNSKKKLLLASPWTRLGSVPCGSSQNLPQVHLTLDHEDIGVARCRQLQEQLQKKHTLTSSKPATSDPNSCEIHPKSRVKDTVHPHPARYDQL